MFSWLLVESLYQQMYCSRSQDGWGTCHTSPRLWHRLGTAGCEHQAQPARLCSVGGTRTLTLLAIPLCSHHSCNKPIVEASKVSLKQWLDILVSYYEVCSMPYCYGKKSRKALLEHSLECNVPNYNLKEIESIYHFSGLAMCVSTVNCQTITKLSLSLPRQNLHLCI